MLPPASSDDLRHGPSERRRKRTSAGPDGGSGTRVVRMAPPRPPQTSAADELSQLLVASLTVAAALSSRQHSRRGCCSRHDPSANNGPERCLCRRERSAAQTGDRPARRQSQDGSRALGTSRANDQVELRSGYDRGERNVAEAVSTSRGGRETKAVVETSRAETFGLERQREPADLAAHDALVSLAFFAPRVVLGWHVLRIAAALMGAPDQILVKGSGLRPLLDRGDH